jgi:general secretion pathway protein D
MIALNEPIPVRINAIGLGLTALLGMAISGCGPVRSFEAAPEHLEAAVADDMDIPELVTQIPTLPAAPQPAAPMETYTVDQTEVAVQQLLFALARDAKVNVDIHSEIRGVVTMNAIDQTLPQILERIAKQVSLRYTLEGQNLLVMPDLPYWHNYRVDYVNMSRTTEGEVSIATQIASTGGSVGEDADSGGSDGESGNISSTSVTSTVNNDFWGDIEANLLQILGATSTGADVQGTAQSPIIVNPLAGVVSAYATQQEHRQLQAFIDHVTANAKRQVMIEVTVAEVVLGDQYQAGIDWSRVSKNAGTGNDGVSFLANLTGNNLATAPFYAMTYNNFDPDGSGFSAAVSLLEQFGDTKVLSTPRIMALNNQTALLKVVDERVYFSLEQETIEGDVNNAARTIVTSEIHTVPIGFIMSVTPQINDNGNVSLNIRPTITRIIDFVVDPAPRVQGSDFDNLVPQIHVSELESLLEVADSQTVILGGLMQDEIKKNKDAIPGLSRLPGIGNLFTYRDEEVRKTELVLFLRPTVIRDSGVSAKTAVQLQDVNTSRWSADSLAPGAFDE